LVDLGGFDNPDGVCNNSHVNNVIYASGIIALMLKEMVLADSQMIRELKETAKWGMDKEKKRAILALANYGKEGVSAIHEVLDVTVYPEIKQACIEAIKSVGNPRAKAVQKRSNNGRTLPTRRAIKSKKARKRKSRR
jgi:hypothetical protein